MGLLNKKILGTPVGAVGDVQFQGWNGLTTIKPKATQVRNPNTAGQRLQRQVLRLCSFLVALVPDLVKGTWRRGQSRLPGYNLIMSFIMPSMRQSLQVQPDGSVDPTLPSFRAEGYGAMPTPEQLNLAKSPGSTEFGILFSDTLPASRTLDIQIMVIGNTGDELPTDEPMVRLNRNVTVSTNTAVGSTLTLTVANTVLETYSPYDFIVILARDVTTQPNEKAFAIAKVEIDT